MYILHVQLGYTVFTSTRSVFLRIHIFVQFTSIFIVYFDAYSMHKVARTAKHGPGVPPLPKTDSPTHEHCKMTAKPPLHSPEGGEVVHWER